MIRVKDIFDYLNSLYPVDTACDFDNVGLLVGDSDAAVTGAVVALDCDVNTISFAKDLGANLIITHHPVIFEPVKSVTENDIVFKLIKSGISVISMHTNLDIGAGGVNDVLCETLELKNVKPYIASDGYMLKFGVTDIEDVDRFAAFLKQKLGGAVRYVSGNKPIKNLLVCSGSGGGYVDEAINGDFDALVTADVKHNHFIAAINGGIALFDGGHYNTENIITTPLLNRLKNRFESVSLYSFSNSSIKTL